MYDQILRTIIIRNVRKTINKNLATSLFLDLKAEPSTIVLNFSAKLNRNDGRSLSRKLVEFYIKSIRYRGRFLEIKECICQW